MMTTLKYLQHGDTCTCGSGYSKYGNVPERDCNIPCADSQGQMCGGTLANSVYSTICKFSGIFYTINGQLTSVLFKCFFMFIPAFTFHKMTTESLVILFGHNLLHQNCCAVLALM